MNYKKIHDIKISENPEYTQSLHPQKWMLLSVRYILGELPPESRILELWVGLWANAIHLAQLWHFITAEDVSVEALTRLQWLIGKYGVKTIYLVEWSAHEVREVGSEYNCVIATYLLHFLTPADARSTILRMQDATLPWGYNVLEWFTSENPQYNRPDRFYPKESDIIDLYPNWVCLKKEYFESHAADNTNTRRYVYIFQKIK
jgi:ubiquinone/menaquinone biosynthesis C-methylase UbiE